MGAKNQWTGARLNCRVRRVCIGLWVALASLCTSALEAQQPQQTSITPPVVLFAPLPQFPAIERPRDVTLTLILAVNDKGRVENAIVTERAPVDASLNFDAAAMICVQQMVFEPAKQGTKPIPSSTRYTVVFRPPATLKTDSKPEYNALPWQLAAGTAGAPVSGVEVKPSSRDEATQGLTIRTRRAPLSRGGSDFFLTIGGLRHVPRRNASDLLRLAPGILLTNEGGEGHSDTIYLRGFDAHEGQDLEFTVEGVPINEVANPHGEGLANLSLIIPELVRSVRILEGPFDPHQGNYAVAGSAEYELGLTQPGLTAQYQLGSFGTQRIMVLYHPTDTGPRTFFGVDTKSMSGFGDNRAARHARMMGQYELKLSDQHKIDFLIMSHIGNFSSAGVIREDDFQAGRIGFFGTYDPLQGGSLSRHTLSITFDDTLPERKLSQQFFFSLRQSRLRFNYTGFIEDPPEIYRSGVEQRGDMTDQAYSSIMLGARGSVRFKKEIQGLQQAFEVGYYARHDRAESSQKRLRFGTVIPYRSDFDLTPTVSNTGLFADSDIKFMPWLTLRGGLRGDFFLYDVLNNCDLHDTFISSNVSSLDEICYRRDRNGPRDISARRTATAFSLQPRASVFAGPFSRLIPPLRDLVFTASAGRGIRAADPSYVADNDRAPFASIVATEAGLLFNKKLPQSTFGSLAINARALYYYTTVGRDLIFNQQEGRNTLAPGTRRQGVILAGRLTSSWFDWALSATYAHARFVREETGANAALVNTYFPPDAGDVVPFVPDWVVRSDSAVFRPIGTLKLRGQPLYGRLGLGVTYVSPRPLPYGERGNTIFVVDASAGVRWNFVEFTLSGQNLFDQRYRLAEYNYVSEFRGNTSAANLLPVRHFAAGPPLGIFAAITLYTEGPQKEERP